MVTPNLSSSALSGSFRVGLSWLLRLGLAVTIFATLIPIASADPEVRRVKVVFEMTNGHEGVFDSFVANVEGLQKHSGSLADITVVASSQGVELFRTGDEGLQQRLAKLADRGVDFVVCQSGLEQAGITAPDLLGFARIVRSGSDEVERLENQGWARVRDGESYVSHL